MSLVYSAETKQIITRLRAELPQAILLEGQSGVGLLTIAQTISGRLSAGVIQSTDKDSHPDLTEKGMIRLAQIQELQQYARGKSNDVRVFIIDDADRMNERAQNTFLKLLEEPGSNVRFILTSHRPHLLLQTVLSRVQRILIPPVSVLESQHFIHKLGITDPKKIQQLLYIAGGRPAELSRLVANETYFTEMSTLAKDARTLIGGQLQERILIVSKYSSDRGRAMQLLNASQIFISYSLLRSPSPALVELIDRLATAYDRVAANGNIRLQLVNFVIQ